MNETVVEVLTIQVKVAGVSKRTKQKIMIETYTFASGARCTMYVRWKMNSEVGEHLTDDVDSMSIQ